MTRDECVRIISRYETMVERPAGERLTTLANSHLVAQDGVSDEILETKASEYASYLPFCEYVDEMIDQDDPLTRQDYAGELVVLRPTTPASLLKLGLEQRPISCTEHHIWAIMAPDELHGGTHHQHGLSPALVKSIPELLDHPVLVANHPTSQERMIVVLDAMDEYGYPLITPMKPEATGIIEMEAIITNLVLSVYGLKNFWNYFGSAVTPDMVSYIDAAAERSLVDKIGGAPLSGLGNLPRDTVLQKLACVG